MPFHDVVFFYRCHVLPKPEILAYSQGHGMNQEYELCPSCKIYTTTMAFSYLYSAIHLSPAVQLKKMLVVMFFAWLS